jgi:hypothetical protein
MLDLDVAKLHRRLVLGSRRLGPDAERLLQAPPEPLVVEPCKDGIEVVGLLDEPRYGLDCLLYTAGKLAALEIVTLGTRRLTGEILVVARERLVELLALFRFNVRSSSSSLPSAAAENPSSRSACSNAAIASSAVSWSFAVDAPLSSSLHPATSNAAGASATRVLPSMPAP